MSESKYVLHLGDCLEVMKGMPDNSVDSIVTDPPYGITFMSKNWDKSVPGTEFWKEALRVAKPGAHLLAMGGTRTFHRLVSAIEDAGWEIRDQLVYAYGTGLPKSHDVGKAIHAQITIGGSSPQKRRKAYMGDDYVLGETYGKINVARAMVGVSNQSKPNSELNLIDEAKQWSGWGTALKPSSENVAWATKPLLEQSERDIIQSNLIRLEARLWLLLFVNVAEKSLASNRVEYNAACDIAQWSVEEIINTRAALCDLMDTSLFELATTTSLNIVSSWRHILAESLNDGNTFTTETKSSATIDWRTLKFSLSQITPSTIIRACSLPGGFAANANTAESHFSASLSLLQSIQILFATERVMLLESEICQNENVNPKIKPITMARKPLVSPCVNVLDMVECQLRDRGVTGDILWKPENASGAEKSKKTKSSGSTKLSEPSATSAKNAAENETQKTGPQTPKSSEVHGISGAKQTPEGKGNSRDGMTEDCANVFSQPTAESVSAAANPNPLSSLSTTLTAGERSIESKSTEKSMPNCGATDSRPDTEFFVGIATGLTGSMATVRINRDSDGMFIWPMNLPKSIPGKTLTVAQNVLQWGTGAINVDGCRVGTYADMNPNDFDDSKRTAPEFSGMYNNGKEGQYLSRTGEVPNGRWPANLILSYPEDEYGLKENITPKQLAKLAEWMNENA